MNSRLLTIGECMVEMSLQENGQYALGFAGDSLNTAYYARKIAPTDLEVAFLTAVGDDDISDKMVGFFEDQNIIPKVARRAGETVGLYMISLQDGERSFSYWRSASAARSLAQDLSGLATLSSGDLVLITGITLAILPAPGREALFAALRTARENGVKIAFDPNLRPRLWENEADMLTTIMQGAAVADIVLPSFEDEDSFFKDGTPQGTIERYRAAGAQVVIVKNGAGPILIWSDEGTQTVAPTPAEKVVDTTAAGDSFNAGFLVGLQTGATLVAATTQGCDLARQVIGKRGALVAL